MDGPRSRAADQLAGRDRASRRGAGVGVSGRARGASRGGIHLLQAAMMVQILLGLTRFFGPRLGWALPEAVWRIHPLLGISIAVAVLVVLRPRHGTAADRRRKIARVAPLAPLALGVAIALGLRIGPVLVPLHMVVGLTALGLVDNALKQLLVRPARGGELALSPPVQV
jgi:hypothetical protein